MKVVQYKIIIIQQMLHRHLEWKIEGLDPKLSKMLTTYAIYSFFKIIMGVLDKQVCRLSIVALGNRQIER